MCWIALKIMSQCKPPTNSKLLNSSVDKSSDLSVFRNGSRGSFRNRSLTLHYLQDLLKLFVIFHHKDVGLAVLCHILARLGRVGGVDAHSKPPANSTQNLSINILKSVNTVTKGCAVLQQETTLNTNNIPTILTLPICLPTQTMWCC